MGETSSESALKPSRFSGQTSSVYLGGDAVTTGAPVTEPIGLRRRRGDAQAIHLWAEAFSNRGLSRRST